MDQKIKAFEEKIFAEINTFANMNGIEATLLVPYMMQGLQELADIEAYRKKIGGEN